MIDAHQHFWQRSRGDYAWLAEEKPVLRDYDYLPGNLAPELSSCDITGTILVQAAETTEESRFILELAAKTDFILGVVCWLDFDDPNYRDLLDQYQKYPKCVGIRPVLQGIEQTDWILEPHRIAILQELAARKLTFDALVQPRHLSTVAKLLNIVPELKVVIDHGAKPFIKAGEIEPWGSEMKALASQGAVWCKLSGLVTEASEIWQTEHLVPYMETLFEAFGPDKLMWGSDWPVVKSASDYASWFHIAYNFIASYGEQAVQKVFGDNASDFYSVPR